MRQHNHSLEPTYPRRVELGDQTIALYTDTEGADLTSAVELLEAEGFRVVIDEIESERELVARVAELQPSALLITYVPVGEPVFAAAPTVRVVSCCAVGFDRVDVAAADRHGVWVCNVPDAATHEVAAHALAMALALIRRLPFLDRHVRDGGWSFEAGGMASLPSELTLGIIGLGRIGSCLAGLASGLFAEVVGCDPLLGSERWPIGVRRLDLDQLLATSDVVSLHTPLTAASDRLIDARALELLRPGAMLVNVSRGRLVDETALLDALDRGGLGGAALDVTDPEPPEIGGRLRLHPRVMLTPHAAFYSTATPDRYLAYQAANVTAWKRGEIPRGAVNRPGDQAQPAETRRSS
jgi:D-3-phosphoglycerate dehydrogenase